MPYKRHESETIKQIISGPADEVERTYPCEASTVYRIKVWFSLLREYLESSIQALKELYASDTVLYAQLCELVPLHAIMRRTDGWLKRLVRIVVNSGRWPHTRSAYAVR